VKVYDALASAAALAASRRQAASLSEEETLWRYLRTLNAFVHVTGQVYSFEDSFKGMPSAERPHVSARLDARKGTFAHLAMQLLLKALAETPDLEKKQHMAVLIALLNFIADTDQIDDAEDFFSNQQLYAPVAIAHFSSQEEAKAWLEGGTEPPSPALILIGDEYYQFWHMREDNTRGMYRDHAIEPALEALTARGIPSQTPSFATRAEVEEWLMSHPAAPYAFVAIAGEPYFAVHHQRLKRHSLHPVASTLKAWEERKRTVELEQAQEAARQPDTTDE
jgi:hypothetical protein